MRSENMRSNPHQNWLDRTRPRNLSKNSGGERTVPDTNQTRTGQLFMVGFRQHRQYWEI
jgi:hypothetical protein